MSRVWVDCNVNTGPKEVRPTDLCIVKMTLCMCYERDICYCYRTVSKSPNNVSRLVLYDDQGSNALDKSAMMLF